MRQIPPQVTRPRHWLMGPAWYVRQDPLKWIFKWIEEYGDIYTIKTALGRATVVARPEWARHVLADAYNHYQRKSISYSVLRILFGNGLVTSEGEFWRRQRKLIQPAFHHRRLQALFSMMVESAEDCASRLAVAAKSGHTIDIAPVFSQLTLDIISRAMFSTDVEGTASQVSRHIALLNEYALRMLRNPWLFLLPRKLPLPFTRKQVNALRALNEIVHGIIQARRRAPGDHDDLLAMLLSACEEETGRGMSDDLLRDEVMTIFVAGHETSANAMAWLLYLVSQHPEVEQKLLAEIDAQWTDGGPLSAEKLAGCTYLRQVIEESLRLYPSIWSVGRQCTATDEIGGFDVPQGMNVIVPIIYFHWSERYWDKPQRFDPDRFLPARRPSPEQMNYFPFGAGPRSCIGNHFAMQEIMVLTAVFLRRFTFSLEPNFRVEPDALITLRPRFGMKMRIHARQDRRLPAMQAGLAT